MKSLIVILVLMAILVISGCASQDQTPAVEGRPQRPTITIPDCGFNIECFAPYALNCEPAKLLIKNSSQIAEYEYVIEFYEEIKGRSGNDCLIFYEYREIELPEDMPEMYRFIEILEGTNMTCKIPMDKMGTEEMETMTIDAESDACEGNVDEKIEEYKRKMTEYIRDNLGEIVETYIE